MSLQKLGKKDSPPVIVNGVDVTGSPVVRHNAEKDPPPGFDLTRLVERAAEVARERGSP